jgi:hypothetical protein
MVAPIEGPPSAVKPAILSTAAAPQPRPVRRRGPVSEVGGAVRRRARTVYKGRRMDPRAKRWLISAGIGPAARAGLCQNETGCGDSTGLRVWRMSKGWGINSEVCPEPSAGGLWWVRVWCEWKRSEMRGRRWRGLDDAQRKAILSRRSTSEGLPEMGLSAPACNKEDVHLWGRRTRKRMWDAFRAEHIRRRWLLAEGC